MSYLKSNLGRVIKSLYDIKLEGTNLELFVPGSPPSRSMVRSSSRRERHEEARKGREVIDSPRKGSRAEGRKSCESPKHKCKVAFLMPGHTKWGRDKNLVTIFNYCVHGDKCFFLFIRDSIKKGVGILCRQLGYMNEYMTGMIVGPVTQHQ